MFNLVYVENVVYLKDFVVPFQPFGTIPQSDFTLTLHAFAETRTVGSLQEITRIIVSTNYTWINIPCIPRTDNMSFNWDANVFGFVSGSFSAEDLWRNRDTGRFEVTQFVTSASKLEQGGLGHHPRLIILHEQIDLMDGLASH